MTEVFVVDTETTGLGGAPYDLVVDIGISKVDLETFKVSEVYSAVVGYPLDVIDTNAWIFSHSDLTVEDVLAGVPFLDVKLAVYDILRGQTVTSFNTGFDLDKFLYAYPWDLSGCFSEAPCIMKASMDVCRIPSAWGGYKWPKLQEAYDFLYPDIPLGDQSHRALSDAVMAGFVLLGLYMQGDYVLGVSS
jgi:DNA polymerase-3 subunit epsilon